MRYLFIFLWLLPSVCFSATLYMGSGETYTTLQSAMSAMSGGDTLIIRDGTYSTSADIIDQSHYPPAGTAGAYTTIRAEHKGKVFFGDPDSSTRVVNNDGGSVTNHIAFDGITWLTLTTWYGCDYIKITNCGAGTNITSSGGMNFYVSHASYFLIEDSHAWGGGRYKFLAYESDHVIFRRCVGRQGQITVAEPLGGIGFYYTSYSEAQNCIMIDSKTSDYWDVQDLVGAFTLPNGNGSNNAFRGCIALSLDMPTHGEAAGYTSGINFENIVGWDTTTGYILRGNITYSHLTLGEADTNYSSYAAFNQYEHSITLTDSIFVGNSATNGTLTGGGLTGDYNYFYNNYNNYGTSSAGAHDVTNINPLTNGLKYLVRIEDNSNLDGVASDDGDPGATILKRIGVSGTYYGETGYNTTTSDDLWPWPNEDIIRTNFKTYDNENISADRGFCADGVTLSSYIWEYLGNDCPAGMCTAIYTGSPLGGASNFKNIGSGASQFKF